MAHFAELDGNNTVIRVVVIDDAEEADGENFCMNLFGTQSPNLWKQTSYNTRDGVHYAPNSFTPDGGVAFRKHYAYAGCVYDPIKDEFFLHQPFDSWTLDSNNDWQPPTPYPADGGYYDWEEGTQSWTGRILI